MEELIMEKDLIKFMENVKPINKDLSLYEDDNKGVMFYLNTVQLLTKVELLELDKKEYTVKKFEGGIEDLEYDIIEVERPVSKYNITKKEEDKYTITNSKVAVRKVYNVSNAIGIYKSFTNKDDAMKLAKDINKNIITYFE
jgi:hypothetical protein